MIEYKGYTGVFEFDSDLELFSGYVVDLRDQIYFEGGSVEELKASMHRAVDHYLEVCASRGEEPEKPFSGKLNVRLGPNLHRAVAVAAAARGESINSWLIHVVSSAAEQDPNVVPLTGHETRGGKQAPRNKAPSKKRAARKRAATSK
ncbi:type II toxin-antitoxin system HicB family antitoxin, partial [Gemmatimonadota bacterium]